VVPCEVIAPLLLSRMIERNVLTVNRIAPFDFVVFVIVTPLTRQSKVIYRVLPFLVARYDVFN